MGGSSRVFLLLLILSFTHISCFASLLKSSEVYHPMIGGIRFGITVDFTDEEYPLLLTETNEVYFEPVMFGGNGSFYIKESKQDNYLLIVAY